MRWFSLYLEIEMTTDELMCLIVLLILLVVQIHEYVSLVLANRMLNKAMRSGAGWVRIKEKGRKQ